jgi:hypothetical protein
MRESRDAAKRRAAARALPFVPKSKRAFAASRALRVLGAPVEVRGVQPSGQELGMKSLAILAWAALPAFAPPAHTAVPPADGVRAPHAAIDGYDPCKGKSCGDACHACPPDEPTCLETAVLKYCGAEGACAPERPTCR